MTNIYFSQIIFSQIALNSVGLHAVSERLNNIFFGRKTYFFVKYYDFERFESLRSRVRFQPVEAESSSKSTKSMKKSHRTWQFQSCREWRTVRDRDLKSWFGAAKFSNHGWHLSRTTPKPGPQIRKPKGITHQNRRKSMILRDLNLQDSNLSKSLIFVDFGG